MIGHTNRQTEITTLYIKMIIIHVEKKKIRKSLKSKKAHLKKIM